MFLYEEGVVPLRKTKGNSTRNGKFLVEKKKTCLSILIYNDL